MNIFTLITKDGSKPFNGFSIDVPNPSDGADEWKAHFIFNNDMCSIRVFDDNEDLVFNPVFDGGDCKFPTDMEDQDIKSKLMAYRVDMYQRAIGAKQ